MWDHVQVSLKCCLWLFVVEPDCATACYHSTMSVTGWMMRRTLTLKRAAGPLCHLSCVLHIVTLDIIKHINWFKLENNTLEAVWWHYADDRICILVMIVLNMWKYSSWSVLYIYWWFLHCSIHCMWLHLFLIRECFRNQLNLNMKGNQFQYS